MIVVVNRCFSLQLAETISPLSSTHPLSSLPDHKQNNTEQIWNEGVDSKLLAQVIFNLNTSCFYGWDEEADGMKITGRWEGAWKYVWKFDYYKLIMFARKRSNSRNSTRKSVCFTISREQGWNPLVLRVVSFDFHCLLFTLSLPLYLQRLLYNVFQDFYQNTS